MCCKDFRAERSGNGATEANLSTFQFIPTIQPWHHQVHTGFVFDYLMKVPLSDYYHLNYHIMFITQRF